MTPCYEKLVIGEHIPTLSTPAVSRLQLALFAGAAADHNPIHVDDEAARAGGLPGVIAHGMLTMALLARLVSRWAPPRSLRSFSARFVAMAFPGDVISCSGVVTAKSSEEGENRVVLDLVAENQKGEKIVLGKATIALP